jgi:hypothetical protein
MRYSIPTRYNGTLYRSKLEADWARTFDKLGVEAKYEHEGHYFGDVFYLPDFFLPRTGQFVEVKPTLAKVERVKVDALCAHAPRNAYERDLSRSYQGDEYPVGLDFAPYAVCLPHGEFFVFNRDGGYAQESGCYRCAICQAWWFLDATGSWRCPCCGTHDGDGHIFDTAANLRRRLPEVWR